MAYYAKISNEEFTISESARLNEARHEKGVIEADNRASDGYIALKNMYNTKNTSDTLESLQDELKILLSQDIYMMTEEEIMVRNTSITEKQTEIDAEKNILSEEAQELLDQMKILEDEGTEDLVAEIETLNTAIVNALCRVTAMYTGADEFTSSNGEVTEEDNTVYWEGYYGGCKRTSYNTQGGVHTLGGTPFRKNYAGVGYIYDPVRDAFYTEQPFASWTLDESTCYWQPPTPRPEEGVWYWKEDTTEWVDYVYYNPDGNQPFPSWTWDGLNWNPPVEYPDDGLFYIWNEETLTWVEM